MSVKNILIVGAFGVALIYFMSNQKTKTALDLQPTQYGGYGSHPSDEYPARESGMYYV
jgi:hypothetical protein